MTLPVWMYWEGECPEWIRACERTVRARAPDVRLVTPHDFDRMRSTDRDIDLAKLCTAHRADFIRVFLLARHGGIWLDSDCVVLRHLQPMLDLLEKYDFVGYKERQGYVTNNFMGAARLSVIVSRYYQRICRILRAGQPLSWLSLGSYALTETIQEAQIPWYRIGYDLIQPVCWSNPAAFFAERDREGHQRVYNERAFCYMLSHNMIRGYEAEHPDQPLLGEDTFFSFLLDQAEQEPKRSANPRRSSMGTSNWQQIPFCVEALLDVCPMRVLDVGVGFGRWGTLVREFCEEWKGRTHRENWRVHLEGIEILPKNIEEYHHLFYDWVHVGDAAQIVEQMQDRWDLIICGDVLQLWSKEIAQQLLERALDLADYVLVNSPVGAGWERTKMYDNPFEEHRSFWHLKDLLTQAPVRYEVYKEYNGRDYGAFLLSRTDPRRLRKRSAMEDLFSNVYRHNLWLDEESVSGPGSRLSETARIREHLPTLLTRLQAKSLLDAPCGDFHWMQHVELGLEEYIGGDIVHELIERHQQNFGGHGRKFVAVDITADELPHADVILCRDCLVHFSYEDAFKAIRNFRRSGARYILTTTYTEHQNNGDITTGGWRPINLLLPPFMFPAALAVINENCTEGEGDYGSKALGLWELSEVPGQSETE
jgi:hypothetical protein